MIERDVGLYAESRILIVDDDASTRLMLSKVLEKENYSIAAVSDGEAAINYLEAHEIPDLILLDVMMPKVNGYEVCEYIRSRDQKVPVVMLTGLEAVSDIDRAFEVGATDFITKPISWPVIVRRVRYALRTYTLTRKLDQVRVIQEQAQETAKLGFFEWNFVDHKIAWSTGLLDILKLDGRVREQGLQGFLNAVAAEDRERVQEQMELVVDDRLPKVSVEHDVQVQRDGHRTVHHVRTLLRRLTDKHVLGVVQDITDFHSAKKTVEYQRYHDQLTLLPNRVMFHEQINRLIELGQAFALLSIDIDRFSLINDSLGQDAGDKLLYQFGQRLSVSKTPEHFLARVGPDEFVLLIEDPTTEAVFYSYLGELQRALREVYHIDSHPVFIETSLGVVFSWDVQGGYSEYDSAAKQARREAKVLGGSRYAVFDQNSRKDFNRRILIEAELRKAIEQRDFVLYYQPQIELESNRMVGVEALIRWIHPELGFVSPGEFIPLAEELDLIHAIGDWVMDEAIRQASEWYHSGLKLRVGFNLSGRQLNDESLVPKLKEALEVHQIPADYLDVEITESAAMTHPARALKVIEDITALGVNLAIDDFGTGYSSLEYLQKFNANMVKIDRAFVQNITTNPGDQGIVKAVIGIARSMGIKALAEGVESRAEMDMLRSFGCDEIQGFLIAKPLEPEKLRKFALEYRP